MKPSQYHSNKGFHNWLAYKIGDAFLEKYSSHYRGALYDLGCGEAPYKEYFLQYADSYTGVDWTKTLHNSRADIVSNLNEKIDLADEVADTIISLSVLEHLCEPQVMLREAYRILRPGGLLSCKCLGSGGCMRRPMIIFATHLMGLNIFLRRPVSWMWLLNRNRDFLPC